jgi:hypothetical protein
MSQKLSPKKVTLLYILCAVMVFLLSVRTPSDFLSNIPVLLILAAIPIVGYLLLRWKQVIVD